MHLIFLSRNISDSRAAVRFILDIFNTFSEIEPKMSLLPRFLLIISLSVNIFGGIGAQFSPALDGINKIPIKLNGAGFFDHYFNGVIVNQARSAVQLALKDGMVSTADSKL